MSVMVALLPVASGLEEGSELLQAAAGVLIGGLLTSTLLALVFVPAMYTIFDDMQAGVVRIFRRLSGSAAAPERALATASASPSADGHGTGAHVPASGPVLHSADGGHSNDRRPEPPKESPCTRPGTAARASGPRQR
jgi:hypothetical protein